MYHIYLGNRKIAEVAGTEAAWAVYRKTVELADLLGETAHLTDIETGEAFELPAC